MRINQKLVNLSILIATTMCLFLAGEILIRLLTHTSDDNNRIIRGKVLKPYKFPQNISKKSIDDYEKNIDERPSNVWYRYDALLGWKPNSHKSDTYNEQGILNTKRVFTDKPEDGVLRIALFGDSMTRSSGPGVDKSWGYLLEKTMTNFNYNIEVMNFGVGGYGIDQAYMRWEVEGKKYSPHVVIFGFYPMDIGRCLEVHKLKNWGLFDGGNFFSKPRFVYADGTLKLINYPTIPIKRLLDNVESFENLQYIAYDTIYAENKKDYERNFWRASYLLSFIETNLVDNRFSQTNYHRYDEFYDPEKEGARVAIEIMKLFQKSVHEEHALFLTILLPMQHDLSHLKKGRPLGYTNLIDMMSQFSPIIHTAMQMKDYDLEKLYVPDGHFSAFGNEVVAKILSEYLVQAHIGFQGHGIKDGATRRDP